MISVIYLLLGVIPWLLWMGKANEANINCREGLIVKHDHFTYPGVNMWGSWQYVLQIANLVCSTYNPNRRSRYTVGANKRYTQLWSMDSYRIHNSGETNAASDSYKEVQWKSTSCISSYTANYPHIQPRVSGFAALVLQLTLARWEGLDTWLVYDICNLQFWIIYMQVCPKCWWVCFPLTMVTCYQEPSFIVHSTSILGRFV